MVASDDIKQALASIGFTFEDVSPEDDPAYTSFERGTEVFHVCLGHKTKPCRLTTYCNRLVPSCRRSNIDIDKLEKLAAAVADAYEKTDDLLDAMHVVTDQYSDPIDTPSDVIRGMWLAIYAYQDLE